MVFIREVFIFRTGELFHADYCGRFVITYNNTKDYNTNDRTVHIGIKKINKYIFYTNEW